MNSRTTSSAWIQGIAEMLEDARLDVAAILAEAGIERAILSSPDRRAPTEKVSRLWSIAAERSGNPAIKMRPCDDVRS